MSDKNKITKYRWTSEDQPGHLRQIHKNHLYIDYGYQRELNENKVLNIARDWSWMAFGTITVSERDGKLFVVDGQHRVFAARKRPDIEMLPCVVLDSKTQIDEARGFLTAQTQRKPITTVQRFKALLVVKDPSALIVDELVRQSGRVVGHSSCQSTVQCTSVLLRIAALNEKTLRKLWPMIVSLSSGHPIYERLVDGLFYLETHMPEGQSLLCQKWSKRLSNIGINGLMDSAAVASSFYKKGGAKVWATGFLNAINSGLRNRLEIVSIDERL